MSAPVVALLPSPLSLPDGPRAAFERSLAVIEGAEGFEDRLFGAHEAALLLHNLRWSAAITNGQYAAAMRRLRSVLQSDLGAVVTPEHPSALELGEVRQ